MDKFVTLDYFLTSKQIDKCLSLWIARNSTTTPYAKMVCEKVIAPNIKAINKKLGQENDPMYLVYAIEYVMMRGESGSSGNAK